MTDHRWITIQEVTLLLSVSQGHARLLAHRHQWRRTRLDGHVRYWLTDVLDTPRSPKT